MTLMEMQNLLGSHLRDVTDTTLSPEERNEVFERAVYAAKIAKQLVNNADVILRTDKLCGITDRINRIVGE